MEIEITRRGKKKVLSIGEVQADALEAIAQRGPLAVRQISEAVHTKIRQADSAIRSLEKQGLVERFGSVRLPGIERDKMHGTWRLTAAGGLVRASILILRHQRDTE